MFFLLAARNVYHASHGSRTRMARSRTAVTAARTDLQYVGMAFLNGITCAVHGS